VDELILIKPMNKQLTLILSVVALVLGSSCSSTPKHRNLKPATVLDVHTHIGERPVSGGPSLMLGTQLALVGSQVGCGVAAHVVGAAVGALVGGGGGYALERNGSRTHITCLYVQLDDGMKATVSIPKLKRPVRVGDRVWVQCNSVGLPEKLVESAAKVP
jgi:outer membrane lipoprotein SlyB